MALKALMTPPTSTVSLLVPPSTLITPFQACMVEVYDLAQPSTMESPHLPCLPCPRFAQSVIELHATMFHAYETGWSVIGLH